MQMPYIKVLFPALALGCAMEIVSYHPSLTIALPARLLEGLTPHAA